MSRLPPLNALRAFEAVARHRSFKRAADELFVTPAAVSHQIKTLEDFLGFPLLDRASRTMELTEAGRRCFPGIHAGFESMRAALAQAGTRGEDARLVVTAGPAFTSKWLAPRLRGFAEEHPRIDTRISATLSFSDLSADGVDVAIRFGSPRKIENLDRTSLYVERLVEESVLPLCSPDLTAGDAPAASPQDLATLPLIHDDSLRAIEPGVPDWAAWLDAARVHGVDAGRGLRFNHADHALQAAVDGAGVVLGRRVLATPDLAKGRLVTPFGPELRSGLWFHFVCPLAKVDHPSVAAFRLWLRRAFEDEFAVGSPGSRPDPVAAPP